MTDDRRTGWATANVTTPTPEDMLALRELVAATGDGTVTCGCWRCTGSEPDGTLHALVGTVTFTEGFGVFLPDVDACTHVDEHDGEGSPPAIDA